MNKQVSCAENEEEEGEAGSDASQLPVWFYIIHSCREIRGSLMLTRGNSLVVFTSRYGRNLSGVTSVGTHAK